MRFSEPGNNASESSSTMKTRSLHHLRNLFAIRRLIQITEVSMAFACATVPSHGELFNFSYTFQDGTKISGILSGTPTAGGIVGDVSAIEEFLNGVALSGPIYADHFVTSPEGGSHITGIPDSAIVSTDITKNNFDFIWGTPAPGNDFVTFAMRNFSFADVLLITPGEIHSDRPAAIQSSWSLTHVAETNTALTDLLGFGFVMGLYSLMHRTQGWRCEKVR